MTVCDLILVGYNDATVDVAATVVYKFFFFFKQIVMHV